MKISFDSGKTWSSLDTVKNTFENGIKAMNQVTNLIAHNEGYKVERFKMSEEIPFPSANYLERQREVSKIEAEIEAFAWNKVKKENLTYGEIFKMLNNVSNSFAKQMIR